MAVVGGLLLAFGSALAINWSFFRQHGASNELPALSLRHPFRSLWHLFTDRRWLLGYGVGMAGWGLYIAALVFAPISLVQAVSAGGIGLLALLVHRGSPGSLPRQDRAAVLACLGGLALVLLSFLAGVPTASSARLSTVIVWIAATAGAAALSWACAGRILRPGASLGLAAGLLFAAGDVSTKGAVVVGVALVPVLVVCLVLGFVALQLAFQRGSALATAGVSSLVNNALPIVAGMLLFHERLPHGVYGVVRVAGFVLVVIGAAALARPDPTSPDPVPAATPATPTAEP